MRLNDQVISIAEAAMSVSEFDAMVEKGNLEVFEEAGINKFFDDANDLLKKGEADALSTEENESIEKAVAEAKTLTSHTVMNSQGHNEVRYTRPKPEEAAPAAEEVEEVVE